MKQKTSIISLILLGCFLLATPVFGQGDFSLDGLQADTDSTAIGECNAHTNPLETHTRIDCTSDAADITEITIGLGRREMSGPTLFFFDVGTAFSGVVDAASLEDQASPVDFSGFLAELREGNLYVNVHTTGFPGGEIRGQIPPPPGVFFFSQFGNGDGFSSDIVLLNTATTGDPITATAILYDPEGNPIPGADGLFGDTSGDMEPSGIRVTTHGVETSVVPLSSNTLSSNGTGDLILGSVMVLSDVPDGPLDGFIRFNIPGLGNLGIGPSEVIDHGIAAVRRSGGLSTGLAIRNTEERDVLVTLSLRVGGVEVDNGSAEVTLAENARLSLLFHEIFEDADTDEFNGTVVMWADGGVAALAVEVGDGNLTALPVIPIDPPPAG